MDLEALSSVSPPRGIVEDHSQISVERVNCVAELVIDAKRGGREREAVEQVPPPAERQAGGCDGGQVQMVQQKHPGGLKFLYISDLLCTYGEWQDFSDTTSQRTVPDCSGAFEQNGHDRHEEPMDLRMSPLYYSDGDPGKAMSWQVLTRKPGTENDVN
ncbi:hypothetical protein TGPRC2_296020 [Toxoplasma gondii TgCatPRC2]|uniref:Uncharacterized protein n=11 Tax=Toxoplasma gondii TaxID=5811 RepID=A0A0F7USW6_TOXGV|nr:hypothetical protein TGME49_296020 [Toxoplasma gondii ME49]EPR57763.1 hypothetical protein TGGT1_296020 [Toxoplasma gondii GT1]ESS29141.1 hypothetical protein TGVEG_296020 [Toxoplasma gondii VEG]KAF4646235.1 hypothetical protein TGRH88_020220 [Toxoplasma gondii]KFG28407.1 hypothetical protein TGP89_296020 [Toxoplasma gondii p89]KFG36038.1 hypothetical protein TGFOU_296020 [Toxoplasma gondii FOU]KFG37239.1 hypothetical protein TGDOM2_296020 [Toxoplasma gondii GAB2-2007-GAL-DOM2]KFH05903.1 |eukprot:XP_002371531.1 hypothetical protein TGME49_296020 [Toxoplasma gondii ME49]